MRWISASRDGAGHGGLWSGKELCKGLGCWGHTGGFLHGVSDMWRVRGLIWKCKPCNQSCAKPASLIGRRRRMGDDLPCSCTQQAAE